MLRINVDDEHAIHLVVRFDAAQVAEAEMFFEEIEVPPLDKEHAVELIRQPVAGIFSYDAVAVTKIIEYSECTPYTIQRYCVNAINRIIEQKRRRVTAGDVEAVAKVLSA